MPGLLSNPERQLLARHARAVVHMRQQIELKRFGLFLGAGVSKPLGFPMWNELISRIARDPAVQGEQLIAPRASPSQSTRTQVLFQRFRSNFLNGVSEAQISADQQRSARNAWTTLVHRCLYHGVLTGSDSPRHPYLHDFLDIARSAPMTVTYNFDDSLERMISAARTPTEQDKGRGYETVWRPSTQFRSTQAVIYHPNGFLPLNLIEGSSDHLIFSEDAFADQLIASMAGHYATLLSHLSRTTCLLLGLSLEDANLKHLLRQNARQNPGHYHYYVAYVSDPSTPPSPEQQAAVISSNFDVYNLVTLFLTAEEVAGLGRLLTAPKSALSDLADADGVPLSYCFYLSGAVGAGKTTTVGMFPSLTMYDEWADQRHPLLALPFTDLNPEQTTEVDEWISSQFRKKNWLLLNDPEGLQVVDRCQLDPLAFVSDDDRQARAAGLLTSIVPEKSARRLRSGHVILLRGDERVMAARIRDRHKDGSVGYVAKQQSVIEAIYAVGGVTTIDVREMSVDDVARRIARLIHLQPYTECNLHDRLATIAAAGLS